MNSDWLGWIVAAPLAGGLAAALLWRASRRLGASPQSAFWLDAAALVSVCAGLIAGPMLAMLVETGASFSLMGLDLTASPIVKVVLPAAHGALIASVFFSWEDGRREESEREPQSITDDGRRTTDDNRQDSHASRITHHASCFTKWVVWAAMATASLLGGALLIDERIVQALLLFGMALVASGVSVATLRPRAMQGQDVGDAGRGERQGDLGSRVAGGLKHIVLAGVATTLLVVGATMLDRYALNLERRALLQLGLGLLTVGLLVRAGAMPFTGAFTDLVRAAPGVAILVLGAAIPATLGVGLLMLLPIEGSLIGAQQTAWVAAVGVLLAGIRTLPISKFELPVLAAMSVAAQVGWAMFGALSGSLMGAIGAALLAANIAIAAPLLIISYQKAVGSRDDSTFEIRNSRFEIGILVGAASLLGLPPFGGFAGIVMVGQAAANVGGAWLGVMLLGMLLLGVAWLRSGAKGWEPEVTDNMDARPAREHWGTTSILIYTLIATQLGLFLIAGRIAGALGDWAGVPWLSAP